MHVQKGIRVLDIKEGKCISLTELLENVPNGAQLNWGLLWFNVTAKESQGKILIDLQKIVHESDQGVAYSFENLLELSKTIFQEIEVLIIGCKDKKDMRRYPNDQEMYESCDIVLEMIDGGFWEIFAKDTSWINRLHTKYKDTKSLNVDFRN